MRRSISRWLLLSSITAAVALTSTGCRTGGWGWNPANLSSWGWGSGGSTTALASKPTTQVPKPSATQTPAATTSVAAGTPGSAVGSPAFTASAPPANYPTTSQPYGSTYPTQTASAVSTPGAASGVANSVGYQTGPYQMTSPPAASGNSPYAQAPATGGTSGGQSWNTSASGPYGAAGVQTADQRSSAGSPTGYGGSSYGGAAAPYGSVPSTTSPPTISMPPAGEAGGNAYGAGAYGANAYGTGGYDAGAYGGSPAPSTYGGSNYAGGSTGAAETTAPPTNPPTATAPASPYSAAPNYMTPGTAPTTAPPTGATGPWKEYVPPAKPYDTSSTGGAPTGSSLPATSLPSALTTVSGGYRPGSTGTAVQNASYTAPSTGVPGTGGSVYGNTYTR
jgi:hypothetical protein